MVNSIVWFRNDLRITDNAVINYTLENNRKVLPVYICDPSTSLGSASKWWLKNSLISLNNSLKGNLMIIEGEPSKILLDLVNKNSIKEILWNERYSKDDRTQDNEIINIIKNFFLETSLIRFFLILFLSRRIKFSLSKKINVISEKK